MVKRFGGPYGTHREVPVSGNPEIRGSGVPNF